jgi:hypothetical protein
VRDLPGPLLAIVIVLALATGLIGVDAATAAGRIRHGVRVGDVDLSGLTPDAAVVRLQAAAGEIHARLIEVTAGPASTSLSRAEAGVELDVDATVAAAMAVGRQRLVDGNRLLAWTQGVQVPWRARVNDGRLSRLLADLDRRAGHRSRGRARAPRSSWCPAALVAPWTWRPLVRSWAPRPTYLAAR